MDINDNIEQMNIQLALEELDIMLDEIELTTINQEYIKKKYHKMALKWHPDKNKSPYANTKFQKINEAYDYLSRELCSENNNSNAYTFVSSSLFKESNIYINILTEFILSLLGGSYSELFINVLKEIVLDYKIITHQYLKTKFEIFNKQNLIELYQFIYKYKNILYINDDILELVSLVINENLQQFRNNDKVFILRPLLKDIMEHSIYKLYVDDELYLVPLWHNELYFDGKNGSEIIVLCQPKLPENINIDENNNIYYEKTIKICDELVDLIKNNKCVSLSIGDNNLSIPLNKLFLKEQQIYRIKGQGIAHILEKDIYNISYKSDIIVKITLT